MVRMIFGAALLATPLLGCATGGRIEPRSELTIERGPCFGFCPVYSIRTLSRETVEFTGLRHTRSLGTIRRSVDAAAVAELRQALEPYRPRGEAAFPCTVAVSDQAIYTVRWGKAQMITFDTGCRSVEAEKLKNLLENAPEILGFSLDAKQTTRPGASRG